MSSYNATSIRRFDFATLWSITQAIKDANPADPRLFYPLVGGVVDKTRTLLTYKACIQLNSKGNAWVPFAKSDVRQRFLLWKAPLIQLIAQMQLPPLGWKSNLFVILHLIGDPLDTVWSLSHKIFLCHTRGAKWSGDRDWKALGMITISFEEWGEGDQTEKALLQVFRAGGTYQANAQVQNCADNPPLSQDQQENIRKACRDAAQSLSADRSTSFVPVTASVGVFFGTLAAAFDKDSSGVVSIKNGISPYYIAHTALYFGILPAILLSAIVGVSQDRDSIPHIFKQLHLNTRGHVQLKQGLEAWKRITSGGIYSWQPRKWQSLGSGEECWSQRLIAFLSLSSILSGTIIAVYIAYSAPPTGFGCREIAIISTCWLWIFSAAFDIWAERVTWAENCYTLVFLKDSLCSLGIVLYNIYVYLGMYNRCSCWTKFGHGPLSFALEPQVANELQKKIGSVWPGAIIFLVGWQILFVSLVCALSHKGVVILLSSVKNDSSREEKDSQIGWRDIFSTRYGPRHWWQRMRATHHVKIKKAFDGDDVPLAPA